MTSKLEDKLENYYYPSYRQKTEFLYIGLQEDDVSYRLYHCNSCRSTLSEEHIMKYTNVRMNEKILNGLK